MPSPVLKAGSRPPWVGLGAAVWAQIAAGNAYNFPLYSPLLKSVLGLNQQELTILGVASDIGESVGFLPGIACNKFPPWAVLLVGCGFCFLGYGVLWLAVSQIIASMPFVVVGCRFGSYFAEVLVKSSKDNLDIFRRNIGFGEPDLFQF